MLAMIFYNGDFFLTMSNSLSTTVVWLHEDALRPYSYAHTASSPNTVCIFDTDYMRACHYSFKRCVFIYECMLTCNAEIYHGNTLTVLSSLIHEYKWKKLITLPTHNPFFHEIISRISDDIEVIIDERDTFCGGLDTPIPQRFMKYWWKVRKKVLKAP